MAASRQVLSVDGTGPAAVWQDANTYYPALTAGRVAASVMPVQAAIPNLNLGSLTLLTDVITALGTVQASYNTLLSELRTAGILTP